MGKRYNCKYGFSDHTLGIGVPLAAVMLGASVVEKHFTLSKKMYGSDAKNSVEPHEFLELVKAIRDAEISSQVIIEKDDILKGLGNMKLVFEKSIVTTRNLTKGEKIEMGDLAFKKPGNGIPAANYKELIGKVLKQDVNENEQILFDYF
jgi:sialic acid synthase SpsE